MDFPNYLRLLREERGLTLRELSRLCDPTVSHVYIYRLEVGQKTEPSEVVLKSLAKALRLKDKRREMFFYLAKHWERDDSIVEAFLREDSDLIIEDHTSKRIKRSMPDKSSHLPNGVKTLLGILRWESSAWAG